MRIRSDCMVLLENVIPNRKVVPHGKSLQTSFAFPLLIGSRSLHVPPKFHTTNK
jgi:hypothetical protein